MVADGQRCLRGADGTPVEAALSADPAAPASLVRTFAFALPAAPYLPSPPPRHATDAVDGPLGQRDAAEPATGPREVSGLQYPVYGAAGGRRAGRGRHRGARAWVGVWRRP